ncbi:hypothetical protein ACJX0J_033608, partial [Zea mays]
TTLVAVVFAFVNQWYWDIAVYHLFCHSVTNKKRMEEKRIILIAMRTGTNFIFVLFGIKYKKMEVLPIYKHSLELPLHYIWTAGIVYSCMIYSTIRS